VLCRSFRRKDDATDDADVKNDIHEFWDGKITCAMQAEWRNLGYAMYESYPPVKAIFIHKSAVHADATGDGDPSDGCSWWTKYLYRPPEVDALCASESQTPMPTALSFYEKMTVSPQPPAAVRSAVNRPSGSLNDVVHRATWPVQGTHGPIYYSIIDGRLYYYYPRGADDRCVVRAVKARYRTEDWYLRLIAMRVPVPPHHTTDNPDPIASLLTVTDPTSGNRVVHTTFQGVARALGIVTKDNEGELALVEAVDSSTPESLLSLFTQVTLNGQPTLRVLCGLGIDLQSPEAVASKTREEIDDDEDIDGDVGVSSSEDGGGSDEGDETNSHAESDDDSGDAGSHDVAGHDTPATNTETTTAASSPNDADWQRAAANDPDMQRVRRMLMMSCRGTENERVQQLLCNIRDSFDANDMDPRAYGIPLPMSDDLSYDQYERARWLNDPGLLAFNSTHSLRNEQCDIDAAIDEYLSASTDDHATFMTIYVDGRAGTGKTTTMRYILNKARLAGRICFVAAPTNLAALLYQGGQSCHALFELMVTRDRAEVVTSRIRPGGRKASLFGIASIIIVDELPSMKRADFEAMLQILDQVTATKKLAAHAEKLGLFFCHETEMRSEMIRDDP